MQLDEQRRKAKESAEDYSSAKAKSKVTAPMQLNPRSIEGISSPFPKDQPEGDLLHPEQGIGVNIIPIHPSRTCRCRLTCRGSTSRGPWTH